MDPADVPSMGPGAPSQAPAGAPTAGAPSWRRTLWIMMGVQFIMSTAVTVVAPILPLLLPTLGVATPGAVSFWAGVLNALNFLVAALMSPFWGAVGDRYGRKPMVLRASLAICGFSALMGLSDSLWEFVALTALMGAFSGFSSSAISLVATQAPEERLGFALGWLATGQLIGSLAGPLVGGAIADLTGDFASVFFFTAAAAALAAAVAHFGVRERFEPEPRQRRLSLWHGIGIAGTTRGLIPLLFVLLISQFAIRAVLPILTPFVQGLVGSAPNLATLAGLAFSISGIGDIIVSPVFGKRSDTIGYRRVLLIGLAGAGAASIPQAAVGDYWQLLVLRFALGVFVGAVLPTTNALIGRLVPKAERGMAYGLAASAMFLGMFLGPFVGGALAALADVGAVFVLTGLSFLVALVVTWWAVPDTVRGADEG